MCGIAGIICHNTPPEERRAQLAQMLRDLESRGPDAERSYHEGALSFGFRRLAILDLSENAMQPMHSADLACSIVFNGEIYNFKALREELEKLSYTFRTDSDSEVLLNAFHCWGSGCCERLSGMFAFAAIDRRSNKLLLCRDRLGKKPLFIHHTGSRFIFASTLSAVAAVIDRSTPLDRCGVFEFLNHGYTLGRRTVFASIERLLPGEYQEFELGSSGLALRERVAYYKPSLHQVPLDLEFETAAEQFLEKLDHAVTRRLVSDRPIGLFLSGGVDSSTICALTRPKLADRDVHAFCCAFEDQEFSEREGAERTANALDINLHVITIGALDETAARSIIASMGEPLGDSSYPAMDRLCAAAKERIDVVLSGDGADELLLGYETYRASTFAALPGARSAMFRKGLSLFASVCAPSKGKISLSYKLHALAQGLAFPEPRSHLAWRHLFSRDTVDALLPEAETHRQESERGLQSLLSGPSHRSLLRRVQALDFATWLPSDILPKIDLSSMAHGLEVRSPFLDDGLIEFAAMLPEQMLRQGSAGKRILRRAAARLLPSEVFNRPKAGFNAPVGRWLSGPLASSARELFARSEALSDGLIRSAPLQKLLADHHTGVREQGYGLWSVYCLLAWLDSRRARTG